MYKQPLRVYPAQNLQIKLTHWLVIPAPAYNHALQVTYTPGNIMETVPVDDNNDNFDFRLRDLTPNTRYTVNVAAINGAGAGPSISDMETTLLGGEHRGVWVVSHFEIKLCATRNHFYFLTHVCVLCSCRTCDPHFPASQQSTTNQNDNWVF